MDFQLPQPYPARIQEFDVYFRVHTIQCKQEEENALVPNLNSLLDSFELK